MRGWYVLGFDVGVEVDVRVRSQAAMLSLGVGHDGGVVVVCVSAHAQEPESATHGMMTGPYDKRAMAVEGAGRTYVWISSTWLCVGMLRATPIKNLD